MSRERRRNTATPPPIVAVTPPPRSAAAMRAKRILQAAAALWMGPRLLIYRVARWARGPEAAFLAASESIAAIPGARGVYARQAFYRSTLACCGRDVYFGWMSTFSKPQATVGENAYIGRRCAIGLADIGAGALLADGVQLLSGGHQHGLDPAAEPRGDQPQTFRRIKIGAGAWLGTSAIVMADVGEGAVVGAGAVVTRPLPPHTLAIGVPARVVRELIE